MAVVAAVGVLPLVQCTPNRAYRDKDSRPWPHTAQVPFVQGEQQRQYEPFSPGANSAHPFDLSYIEFDEKGDFWDRRQLGWTIDEIKRVARTNNVVLIVYVHGWQNDASNLRGHDVAKFHCLLERLAQAQGEGRRYVGIYFSWRGKSVPGGDGWFRQGSLADFASQALFVVPHELSFFWRKDAATRVASLPMTEAIFETVRAVRTACRDSGHVNKSILIGHSFGALVVEKAMQQALAAQIITADGKRGNDFVPPADFIVLLNSAGEAIYAKEMIDLLRRRHSPVDAGGGDRITSRQPVMVAVTSTADWATGTFFPIGTELGNTGGVFRRYDWDTRYGTDSHGVNQREYFTSTAGHNPHLVSHRAAPQGIPAPPVLSDSGDCSPDMLSAVGANLQEKLVGPGGEVQFVTMPAGSTRTVWTLTPTIPARWQTPYWVVEVPREIMREHSDIFNENSLALLARLFRLSNPAGEAGITMTAQPRTMRLLAPGSEAEGP